MVAYCLEHLFLSDLDLDPVEALKGIMIVINTYHLKISKFLSGAVLLQDLDSSNVH